MMRFVWIALVLQILMVVAGHYVEGVLLLSGPLGTGIPFVLGLWYGATEPTSMGEAAKGGFLIGIVGAVVGVVSLESSPAPRFKSVGVDAVPSISIFPAVGSRSLRTVRPRVDMLASKPQIRRAARPVRVTKSRRVSR